MFWQGAEFDDVLTFGIYIDELDMIHDGRICRLIGQHPAGASCRDVYALYVDGYLVPEHTSPGLSADIISIPGQNLITVIRIGPGVGLVEVIYKYTSCSRAAATICPAPLLPLWAPKRLAPPSTPQRSSSFPRPIRSHAATLTAAAA